MSNQVQCVHTPSKEMIGNSAPSLLSVWLLFITISSQQLGHSHTMTVKTSLLLLV